MNAEQWTAWQGLSPVEGQGAPWIGEVVIRLDSGELVEGVIFIGKDDSDETGRFGISVSWLEKLDRGGSESTFRTIRMTDFGKALKLGNELEDGRLVKEHELAKYGFLDEMMDQG